MKNGFNDLSKKLKKISKGLKELEGEKSIPLTELLSDSFVSQHTKYSTAQEMFDNSGFTIESAEDFKIIPDDQWNTYIASCSSFSQWSEMLKSATGEYVKAEMGLKS